MEAKKGQEGQQNPGTEKEPKLCNVTVREKGQIEEVATRVVDKAEHTRRPRTLGENDKLLTKTKTSTCVCGISFKHEPWFQLTGMVVEQWEIRATVQAHMGFLSK